MALKYRNYCHYLLRLLCLNILTSYINKTCQNPIKYLLWKLDFKTDLNSVAEISDNYEEVDATMVMYMPAKVLHTVFIRL